MIVAELATSPVATAATVAVDFAQGVFRDVPLGDAIATLQDKVSAVQRGDLGDVEATLVSQAAALNSIFSEWRVGQRRTCGKIWTGASGTCG